MIPKYFDIHTHVNFVAFDEDRDEVVQRAHDAGVIMLNVGTQKNTSKAAIDMAEKYDGVYACIGLHPVHCDKSYHDKEEIGEGGEEFTSRGEVFDYEYYLELARHPKVLTRLLTHQWPGIYCQAASIFPRTHKTSKRSGQATDDTRSSEQGQPRRV